MDSFTLGGCTKKLVYLRCCKHGGYKNVVFVYLRVVYLSCGKLWGCTKRRGVQTGCCKNGYVVYVRVVQKRV